MLYHYMYNSPKKQYREVSLVLVTVGTCLVALCLAAYLPLVSLQLDSIQVFLGSKWAIDVSKGTGIDVGYWILWVTVLTQVVQIVLYKHSKLSEERRLVEAKMQ